MLEESSTKTMKMILLTASITSIFSILPANAGDINLLCTLYDTGQKYTTTFRISGDSATIEESSCMPGECIYKANAFVRPSKIDIQKIDYDPGKTVTIFSINRANGKITESVDFSVNGVSLDSYINEGSCQKAPQQQNIF